MERAHAGKHDVRVIDYVDGGEPMLVRMFEKRMRTYRRLGYDTTGPLDLRGGMPGETAP